MTAVLGLKLGPQHDTGACLVWEDGGVLRCCALSEERLSRRKQDRQFPRLSIDAVLAEAGLPLSAVGLVCVDKLGPHTMVEGARPIGTVAPEAWQPEERAFFRALEGKPAFVVNHHLAHAATAYYPFNLDKAAVLVVDGSGSDWPLTESPDRLIMQGAPSEIGNYPLRTYDRRAETQSIFKARGRSLERIATSTRSGIGHFYGYVSKHITGFGQLQEGKLMGLAGWGSAEHLGDYPSFPEAIFDHIDTTLLDYLRQSEWQVPAVRPKDVDATTAPYNHIAYWAQHWLEKAVVHLARTAVIEANSRTLCCAGGVMLNVVANRLARDTLRAEGRLTEMLVQPASSDAGMPMGAALVGYYILAKGDKPFQPNAVYLGPTYEDRSAESELLAIGGSRPDDLLKRVADLLMQDKIVGWWQGSSEYGPRALGARSILVWPRSPGMKDTLNLRVKHREAFRPFAPICREENAQEIFGVDFAVPYMLFNTTVKPELREKLPAITHVDGSGRLQTVSRTFTPRLYDLLGVIRERDGLGVLLNTSFNDAGEPIVETPRHAIDCMRRTGLDALVVGGALYINPASAPHAHARA